MGSYNHQKPKSESEVVVVGSENIIAVFNTGFNNAQEILLVNWFSKGVPALVSQGNL